MNIWPLHRERPADAGLAGLAKTKGCLDSECPSHPYPLPPGERGASPSLPSWARGVTRSPAQAGRYFLRRKYYRTPRLRYDQTEDVFTSTQSGALCGAGGLGAAGDAERQQPDRIHPPGSSASSATEPGYSALFRFLGVFVFGCFRIGSIH